MLQQLCKDLIMRCGGEGCIALQGNATQKEAFLSALKSQADFAKVEEIETGCILQTEEGSLHFTTANLEDCDCGIVFVGNMETREQEEEERAIHQLKALEKTFILIADEGANQEYCVALAQRHTVSCLVAQKEDCTKVIEDVFAIFPLERLDIDLPDWIRVLPEDSAMIAEILAKIHEVVPKVHKMEDCTLVQKLFDEGDVYCDSVECKADTGIAKFNLVAREGIFYKALSQSCGEEIHNDIELMDYIAGIKEAKDFYAKFKNAINMADNMGYGIVLPSEGDLLLQAPEMFKKGTKCGIKLRGEAPSYHIIKVDMQSEVTPVTGENERSEAMAKGVLESYEKDANALWDTNMFGKTFRGMVRDGLDDKIYNMPESARIKLRKALTRIINEGKGGVLCILL